MENKNQNENLKLACDDGLRRKWLMEMEAKQLTDSLTAHISLYNNSSSKTDHNNPTTITSSVKGGGGGGGSRRRSSILKWFSSLTVHQRQAHLTVVDPKLIKIIIQMKGKLRQQGHGFFIILPDMPDSTTQLPTLCFRRSQGGLLSRSSQFNHSERSIYESIRLFNSNHSEDCCLDSMTVCEDFVVGDDLHRFVAAMDGVSNGEFLRGGGGDEDLAYNDWVELDWLKAKGYYSLEAFAANSLELALTLSYYCFHFKKNNNNKKNRRGWPQGEILQKSKDKVVLASNVFLRNKGCIDWWLNLHPQTKTKLFRTFFGKAAKSLVDFT